MGRSIFVDESVQVYIEELLKANKWFTGVIIGQVTQQRDYVVHIARTPDPVEDEAMEENGESDSEDIRHKSKQTVVRPSSLEQLDDKWVSTHAKQVSRMLPGGLAVIGVFVVAPTSMLQACQLKLKQLVFCVHKSLTKNPLLVCASDITDRILLQVDSNTRKLTCTTLDVSDGKSSPRPADWKCQSASSPWTRLESHLSVDVPMTTVSKDNKSSQSSLLRQLQGGLSELCQSVHQAVVCIDDTVREGSELLLAPTTEQRKGKKGQGRDKGKGDNSENTTVSKVQILLPLSSTTTGSQEEGGPTHRQSPTSLRMCGRLTIRAFVPPKAIVADAVQAVRMDVVRSLFARCELLCEEDDVTADREEDSAIYNPPIRFFCPSPNASVDFCDYAFQDEKEEEMVDRVRDLLDIAVDTMENGETNATEEDTWNYIASDTEDTESVASSHKEHTASSGGGAKAYLGAAVGGLVAVVAGGISYLYLRD